MTANKYGKVRAAICWNEEVTRLSRQHNDANIIALPARFISCEEALNFVRIFLTTEFEGGRHERRVQKISCVL
jgi:ribose 5-phosphate isomerase B